MNSNKGEKNPLMKTSFLRAGNWGRTQGAANIMMHILQSIDPFVVYSPKCILTSSEATAEKRLFVCLICSFLWRFRQVFLIIKHKSTHFYLPSDQWITILKYLVHKEKWKVPKVLKFHQAWTWSFGIWFSVFFECNSQLFSCHGQSVVLSNGR